MDIADACSQHGDAEVSDLLALCRICALALAYNAVFFAADSADFCFDGHTLLIADSYEFFCLGNILFERKSGAVEHDGGEASVDALLAAFICAVVKVKSYRNCDALALDNVDYDVPYCLETCHVLAGTLGYLYDDRRIGLLSCLQNCLCPLKVVEVECADCIMSGVSVCDHFLC